jgi:hypothetical protein
MLVGDSQGKAKTSTKTLIAGRDEQMKRKTLNQNQKANRTNSFLLPPGTRQPDFVEPKRGPNFQPKRKKK